METTKEELISKIKEWIKIDTEIAHFQKEIKDRKNKKNQLTDSLVNVMKKNEIDCFDINGGALIYKKTTTKKPINGKTLLLTLQQYYKNNPDVATELTTHILENREETTRETIRRKTNK